MIHTTSLIVLHYTKLGETRIVLHALTPDWGRRSFLASVKGGAGMSLFLPLNVLEAEVVENPKSDLWQLRSVTARHPLNGIRGNLYKNTMTLFMSEVLYRTIRDGSREEGLFDWCERSILTLDAIETDFSNFHLRFLVELAGALGFQASPEDLLPFVGVYKREIDVIAGPDFAAAMLQPLSGVSRSEIAESLLDYLRFHTESSINIQSLKVLRELYR